MILSLFFLFNYFITNVLVKENDFEIRIIGKQESILCTLKDTNIRSYDIDEQIIELDSLALREVRLSTSGKLTYGNFEFWLEGEQICSIPIYPIHLSLPRPDPFINSDSEGLVIEDNQYIRINYLKEMLEKDFFLPYYNEKVSLHYKKVLRALFNEKLVKYIDEKINK